MMLRPAVSDSAVEYLFGGLAKIGYDGFAHAGTAGESGYRQKQSWPILGSFFDKLGSRTRSEGADVISICAS